MHCVSTIVKQQTFAKMKTKKNVKTQHIVSLATHRFAKNRYQNRNFWNICRFFAANNGRGRKSRHHWIGIWKNKSTKTSKREHSHTTFKNRKHHFRSFGRTNQLRARVVYPLIAIERMAKNANGQTFICPKRKISSRNPKTKTCFAPLSFNTINVSRQCSKRKSATVLYSA